ncbi:viroplasmin family protein [Proteiniborus sp.]|uniref:ribonuclease H1 domain-containing protein n=1 Tax=Proteiniborus sp. TaxID=2079015 RepID=UPI00333180AF
MGKKKFYAVRAGRTPGIYQTWGQAEEQVKGFSGAKYKAFGTLQDAEKFMMLKSEDCTNKSDNTENVNSEILKEIYSLGTEQVIAFVDGSYSPDVDGKEKYGFGAILITKESEISLFKAFVNTEYMDSRNVAGEIEGVKQSILWAIANDKNEIMIFYDYEGIEKWATKEWKANKKLTKEYSKFYDEKSKLIKIKFRHVKAHSGILYNERADELAKRSLLSHGYKTYNDGSIYFIGFNVNDWVNIINEISFDNEEFDSNNKIETEIIDVKEYLKRIEVKFNNDSLIVNCYRGNKSFVQGKQSVLFQKLISYAIEKLPNDNSVIETLNTYHALTIDEIEVENEFKNLLPNFPERFSDTKHYNNLLSAVFNTMLVGYMPDYTCLLTPIFRAMDYYLHRILHDKLGKNTENNKGHNNFSYFSKDESTGRYYYNSSSNGLDKKQIDFLNDLYNFYNRIRHPYSHWSQNSIDVQVITEMSVARDLIIEGLKLIDKYYIMC